jgi:glycerol-3-phosphate dehydrogenase (NAD(P)+)
VRDGQDDDTPVGNIGAGAFGTALADVIASAGRRVLLETGDVELARELNGRHTHRRLPGITVSPRVRATASVPEVVGEARLLVLAVSSRRAREVVPELGKVTTGAHAIVHAIGALVQHGGAGSAMVRMSELLRLETPVRRLGVLVGPALARDLAERRPAALVVASPYAEVVSAAQRALSTPPTLRVYGSRDLVGAEIASALAGAFTLGLGMADTLDFGPGPRALLITRGMAEGARLLIAAGGQARTMAGLAGLGNVLARSSPGAAEHSDDYQLGVALARGQARGTSEGLRTLPSLIGLAEALGVRMPILRALAGSAVDGVPIAQAVTRLLEHHADEE